MIETEVGVTGRSDAPEMVSDSSDSSSRSSSGVSMNVPLPLAEPAAITIAKSATGLKSTAVGSPLPDTETVTVVAC